VQPQPVATEASRDASPSPGGAAAAPDIRLLHVSKQFARQDGTRFDVLRDVGFDLLRGEVVAILGPSGSGKTTLLNMAAGLIAPDRGEITVLGAPLGPSVDWSRVGYMFQDDRLLPWRTAVDNAALALEAGSMPAAERRKRAMAGLELVGLSDFATAYPHQLSGGMRSRVALARSLVSEPDVLLMDEPFSRLDAQTRATMHNELLRIHSMRGMSILFVTHDVEEAVVLADHIVVLSARPGEVRRIVDVTLPQPRLDTPAAIALTTSLRASITEFASPEETLS
jgi:ABC-type nitrate/sulfonate/bicarbonate transport system ATPase subunit